MNGRSFEAGDVVWAPDPYKTTNNPRPWLVLVADALPYAGEEYICAGLTTSDLPANIRLTPEDWRIGHDPSMTSFCSPWVLTTIKHETIANPQGFVTAAFTSRIVEDAISYLGGDVSVET